MKRMIRQCVCLVGFVLAGVQQVAAQTFYELVYTDKQGYENHGLMCYTDEQTCHLRLVRHDGKGNDWSIRPLDYVAERSEEGKDSENYTIMVSGEDDTPLFIWLWEEDETQAQQLVPYVSLDEDDEPEQWIRATGFQEIPLRELTPSYANQFYATDDALYRQICAAHEEALATEREVIKTLGDGTDIFKVMYTAVKEAKGEVPAQEHTLKHRQPTGENSCSVGSRPVMHLFVVANTEVADIGAACRTDYSNISNEMRGIAQSLGIRMKEYNVVENKYSKEGLKQQLASLTPASNDIVVFLYTGHGFRFDDQQDAFPMMALTTNDYQPLDGNYVALSDVYNAICNKGARLNIVLSDCCNSKLGERRPVQGNTLFSRGNNNFSRKRLADLFFNAKGSVLSTAASPGEYSWCDAAGGMFTLSFIQSLRREIGAMNTGEVNWQSVVDNTLKTALQRSQNNAEAQNGLKKMQVAKL